MHLAAVLYDAGVRPEARARDMAMRAFLSPEPMMELRREYDDLIADWNDIKASCEAIARVIEANLTGNEKNLLESLIKQVKDEKAH